MKSLSTPLAMLTLLVAVFSAGIILNIQTIKADETVYIRADGSIDPPATSISSLDNITYTLTDNINDAIVVERSDIIIDGAGYTVQGTGSGRGFSLNGVSNVTIRRTNVRGFWYGIHLNSTTNNNINENNITENSYDGLFLLQSSGNIISLNNLTINGNDGIKLMNSSTANTIYKNRIETNNDDGIQTSESADNNITENKIAGNNDIGIYLLSSSDNIINENTIENNRHGIELSSSPHNQLSRNRIAGHSGGYGVWIVASSDIEVNLNNITENYDGIYADGSTLNLISKNNITSNDEYGIWFYASSNNSINGNNIGLNTDAGIYLRYSARNHIWKNNIGVNQNGIWLSGSSNNTITGNNLVGDSIGTRFLFGSSDNTLHHNNFIANIQQVEVDTGYANMWDNGLEGNYWSDYAGVDLDLDGIGDSTYAIDASNTDNYPLMGMFHAFSTALGYYINVISNSTIDDFEFSKSPANITITMHATNTTSTQTAGLCRVSVPRVLMTETSNVTIDGGAPNYANYTLYENGTHSWIYFNYLHSTLEVIIEGLDDEPPTIDVVSPLNMTYTESDIPLEFILYEPTSWMGYSLDGQANTTITGNTTLMGLLDGGHTVTVFANDTANNMGRSSTVPFIVDASPPNIVIISPENVTYAEDVVYLNFTVDEATSWMGYSLDSQANMTIVGNTTLTDLSDGAHNVVVYANDTTGNMGLSNKVFFTIDTTPPTIEIISPENKTYATNSVALNFILYEPTSWMGYSLDGQANTTITGNTTLMGLLDGGHTVTVFANDTANNMGRSSTISFTIDTLRPYIVIISPENVTYAEDVVYLNFTVDEATSWMGYSLDSQANMTIVGNTTLTDLSDGAHNVVVYANDTTGYMGSSEIVHFTIDATPPSIVAISQDPPSDNVQPEDEVRVNATISDNVTGVKQVALNYTANNGTWFTTEMTNLEGDIWNGTIPAFPYCTNVTYSIMAEDNVGHTITSEEMAYDLDYHVIPEFSSIIIVLLSMTLISLVTLRYRKELV